MTALSRLLSSPRRLLVPCGLFVVLVANHAVYAGARPISTPVVNVNTATVAQLAYLPGVGPKLAAAIVAGRPYNSIEALDGVKGIGPAKLAKMRPYVGVYKQTMREIMDHLGWQFVATMGIGTGCRVHLRADELPHGRIIAAVSRHFVAVIDGTIRDTHDPSRGGTRCVYGYWTRS